MYGPADEHSSGQCTMTACLDVRKLTSGTADIVTLAKSAGLAFLPIRVLLIAPSALVEHPVRPIFGSMLRNGSPRTGERELARFAVEVIGAVVARNVPHDAFVGFVNQDSSIALGVGLDHDVTARAVSTSAEQAREPPPTVE